MLSEKYISKAHRILTVVFALVSLVYGYYRNEDSLFWTLGKVFILNVVVQVFYYAISLGPLVQLKWMGESNLLYDITLSVIRFFSVGILIMGLFLFFTSFQNVTQVMDLDSVTRFFQPCFIILGSLSLNRSLQKLS